MTAKNFKIYCKRNKIIKIIPTDYGVSFHFIKNRVIEASCGIDGIIYTKLRKNKVTSTKLLFNQLNEMMPEIINQFSEKYGTV